MVVSAWCLWENPEEKRKLVWEGKQLAQVISCYYSNWAGVEGAFRKKFRSWNAGLIGNPWLCFIWLWGWFYEATYGERKQLMPLVGRVAAVIPTFPWVGSFRLIGNSTGAESERSFLLTAGTFQLQASSAGQWHRSLSSDCFRLRCAALTKLNRPQCLEGCRSSVLPHWAAATGQCTRKLPARWDTEMAHGWFAVESSIHQDQVTSGSGAQQTTDQRPIQHPMLAPLWPQPSFQLYLPILPDPHCRATFLGQAALSLSRRIPPSMLFHVPAAWSPDCLLPEPQWLVQADWFCLHF